MIPIFTNMLNILESLKKKELMKTSQNKGRLVRVHKRDLPANKEWYNSVYAFNKNSTRFLPAVHNYVFKLLKDYFNITNENIQTSLETRRARKLRRASGRKIWISTPEIKHLNGKINITLYVYNKVYNYYKKKLNLLAVSWTPLVKEKAKRVFKETKKVTPLIIKPKKVGITKKVTTISYPLTPKFDNVNDILFDVNIKKISDHTTNEKTLMLSNLSLNKHTNFTKAKDFYIKIIKLLKSARIANIQENITAITKHLEITNSETLLKGLKLLKTRHHNYLINIYEKELLYLDLKQKLLFNEFKFSELYLTPMIEFLQTIYKKKVEFNIVTLKHYFLSSSILSQILVAKIKSPNYRGKSLKPVYKSMAKVRTPNLSGNKIQLIPGEFIGMQNVIFNKSLPVRKNSLGTFLLANSERPVNDNIEQLVLSNLENKGVAGIFIKISGRLTKRYKAQRAVSKLRYKGTLKNVYSAHGGLSSSLSKGYANINVEKTMLHSNTRVGAFGLTGWVASY